MALDHAEIIARVLAQRERWVDIEPGKAVCMRRPPEVEMARLRGGFSVESVAGYAVGWRGITLGDLLGPDAEGAAAEIDFGAELWRTVVADRIDWATTCAQALMELIGEQASAREAARKN